MYRSLSILLNFDMSIYKMSKFIDPPPMTYKSCVYVLFPNSTTYTLDRTMRVKCSIHTYVVIHGVFIHVNNTQLV